MLRLYKTFNRVIICSLMVFATWSGFASAEEVFKEAADFELPVQQGKYKLSDSKGKLVYLDFWASWCGPCKQSFPWMNTMHDKYQSKGLELVGVNLDASNADAQSFLTAVQAKFKIAFDQKGAVPRLYGVKGMPTSYLIDRDGKIIFQHMGFNQSDKDKLEEKIKQYLEAKQ